MVPSRCPSFVHVGVPTARALDRAFELELEIAMLGACVADPAVIDQIAAIVEPDDFLEPINSKLFDALLGRRMDGGKIDAGLITDIVSEALLDDEGAEFVEGYVDNILAAADQAEISESVRYQAPAKSKERAGI